MDSSGRVVTDNLSPNKGDRMTDWYYVATGSFIFHSISKLEVIKDTPKTLQVVSNKDNRYASTIRKSDRGLHNSLPKAKGFALARLQKQIDINTEDLAKTIDQYNLTITLTERDLDGKEET